MKSNLKKKQIVWARTKGHPWWPGIITQVIDGHQYAINFIGDDSQQGYFHNIYSSILTIDNLFDFQDKFDEFNEKVKKNKKLKDAIQKAQKIQSNHFIPHCYNSEQQRRKTSESDEEDKKKTFGIKRNTRKQLKKPETPVQENISRSPQLETPQIQQKKQQLDREFQDLLILLIAAQLNYDQIKQKLTPILDTIEAQVAQNSTITEVLSERKGSILNAVYMILKHQSEQNPDHFFQRDIQQQITRLHDLISKLKNSLLNQFFNAQNIIQDLSSVCQNPSKDKMLKQIMNDEKSKILEKIEKQQSQVSQSSQQQVLQQQQQSSVQVGGLKRLKKKEKAERKQLRLIENAASLQSQPQKKDSTNNEENEKNEKKEEKTTVEQQPRLSNKENILHKKTLKKNEIPDQPLRRKVCFNLLQLVQMIGIEEGKAKTVVLKIESLGRESDPQMRTKYGKLMWNSLVNLDCKLLRKEELLSLIEDNADTTEIWNKITQSNDRNRKLTNI